MMDLGGECAILAQAAATYGAVIIDRGNTNSFAIQPGSQWHSTNIAAFRVQLKDFVYIQ
jgi:predicted RNA methylase